MRNDGTLRWVTAACDVAFKLARPIKVRSVIFSVRMLMEQCSDLPERPKRTPAPIGTDRDGTPKSFVAIHSGNNAMYR